MGRTPPTNGSTKSKHGVAAADAPPTPVPSQPGTTGASPSEGVLERRRVAPRVEEIDDDDDE